MTADNNRRAQRGSKVRSGELFFLAIVLLAYIGILGALEAARPSWEFWGRMLLPSTWLLVSMGAWALFRAPEWSLFTGGRRRLVTVIACACAAAMAAAAPVLLAGEPGGSVVPRLERSAYVLVMVILVPIAEELYFRGFLLSHLKKSLGIPAALVLSAAAFALMHFPAGSAPQMAALGAVTAAVALASDSVLGAIAIHAAWNAAAVLPSASSAFEKALPVGAALGIILAMSALGLRPSRSESNEGRRDPVFEAPLAS
jgi:membrane protease YdiL (CAAX protease family)